MATIAIICGGRDLIWLSAYTAWLREVHQEHGLIYVLVGSNTQRNGKPHGADAQAYAWAAQCGIDRLCHDANWVKYGRPGGPIRNGQLLDLQRDLAHKYSAKRLALALPGDRGTNNMCEQAEEAGVRVLRYEVTTATQELAEVIWRAGQRGQEQLFGKGSL